MLEWFALLMFAIICLLLMLGYPVAFTLGGASLAFAGLGIALGQFEPSFLSALPNRLFGTIGNQTLLAVPMFILMGVTMERSRIAEQLLRNMAAALSGMRAGTAISVVLVGALMAASTGIVGATVVTMGLLSLPSMLSQRYHPRLASGLICATGTLGQIIPPSIALVILGDILSTAYQQAQLNAGIFNPKTVSVGELFIGSLLPGLLLVGLYIAYLLFCSYFRPSLAPARESVQDSDWRSLLGGLLPPLLLIVAVLGSILSGLATPSEAAAIGALGALLLALGKGELDRARLAEILQQSLKISTMIFTILIGATVFSLVFRGFGGDMLIERAFSQLPGGLLGATALVMLLIFLLGFILDFIEICFVVIPIVGPALLAMGMDPVWLGVMIAVNLQTSFLTPPFGFALFYLRGVAPATVSTGDIYRGVAPFVIIQLLLLGLIALWPGLATWLPSMLK